MKKIILLILGVIVAITSFAQLNTYTRQIRFQPVFAAVDTAATIANDGRMWYDFVTDEYRIIRNGVVSSIGEGGGGGLQTASNGLTAVVDDVQLGGSLTDDVFVDVSAHVLEFDAGQNALQIEAADIQISTQVGGQPVEFAVVNELGILITDGRTGAERGLEYNSAYIFDNTDETLSVPYLGLLVGSSTTNEITKNNASGFTGTKIFSNDDGDMDLGDATLAGSSRTISINGSASDINMIFSKKGGASSYIFTGSNANLILGTTTDTGVERIVGAAGSETDIGMTIEAKGAGFTTISGGEIDLNPAGLSTPHRLTDSDLETGGTSFQISTAPNCDPCGTLSFVGGSPAAGNVDGTNIDITAPAGTGTGVGGTITLQVSDSGNIIIIGIPTSSAGLPSGAIWSNAGVLSIIP